MTDRKNTPIGDVRLSPVLEIKASQGLIEGYASMWGGPPDAHGDIIAAGAFAKSLRERAPKMFWAHDDASVIGRWTEVREDHLGLYVKGELNLKTTKGRDAFEHIKAGDVTGASIGFIPALGGVDRNQDGSRTLKELKLFEVSVVAIPASDRAQIRISTKRELQDLLRKSGLPRAAAARVADAGFVALAGPQSTDVNFKSYADRISAAANKMRNSK